MNNGSKCTPIVERNREWIQRVDGYITDSYVREGRGTAQVFGLDMLLNAFWTMEIHLTLAALGAPVLTLGKSFLVVSFGSIGLVLPIAPASLGTYEATNRVVFAGLGWSAGLALSLTIIRRALSLFWAGVGLILIAVKHVRLEPAPSVETSGITPDGRE